MATIMETLVQYLNEQGVGTETHPDGTLEVHTNPEDEQLFVHIKKSGPFQFTATTWRGDSWNKQTFWTEVGTGSWQQVHDELIVVLAELIEDWETYNDVRTVAHVPKMPAAFHKEQRLGDTL